MQEINKSKEGNLCEEGGKTCKKNKRDPSFIGEIREIERFLHIFLAHYKCGKYQQNVVNVLD